MIDILINAGADPNATITSVGSPLHMACCILNRRSVESLLRRGANEMLQHGIGAVPQDLLGEVYQDDAEIYEVNKKSIREVRRYRYMSLVRPLLGISVSRRCRKQA